MTPEVWPLVLIRQRDEPDAQIKLYEHRGWAHWGSPEETAAQSWQARRTWLLKRFLVFFDSVAGDDPRFSTEIGNQLSLSAKMFRHGRRSTAYGIDFLCKFTALEGMVCGPREHGHGKLVKERLSALFKTKPGLEASVAELWRMRCEASHQGKAFSHKFVRMIEFLEMLNLSVMIFALEHITSVSTIDELWNRAASYVLPPEATMERPEGAFRAPVVSAIESIGKWVGAGLFTEDAFTQLSSETSTDKR